MRETSSPADPAPQPHFRWPLLIALALGGGAALIAYGVSGEAPRAVTTPQPRHAKAPLGMAPLHEVDSIALRFADEKDGKDAKDEKKKIAAPELDGGTAWLNTGGPLSLKKDLKGKIVLLDFWTLCCINCIHVLPDLAKLEKKYPNELVVIGVHSPKFDSEKNSESIRKAILRYEITHPVVNDANMRIWRAYTVNSWPTLVLIDPEGYVVGMGSGEGLGDPVDNLLAKLIKTHRDKKTLNEQPLRFDLAKYRDRKDSPLYFPGKVVA